MLDEYLDGYQAVTNKHFIQREKAYFVSVALCNGAFPLLNKLPQILVDTLMVLKTCIPYSTPEIV